MIPQGWPLYAQVRSGNDEPCWAVVIGWKPLNDTGEQYTPVFADINTETGGHDVTYITDDTDGIRLTPEKPNNT